MNRHFSSAAAVFCLLTIAVLIVFAEPQGQSARPVVFTTATKLVNARLITGNTAQIVGKNAGTLRGTATLTIVTANEDDTVTGTLAIAFADDDRKKIGELIGKPPGTIPVNIVKKDVVAGFRNGAACPVLRLEVGETEWEIAGVKAGINRLALEIVETPDPIPQLFCTWTRQINAKRPRRGIIAAINRLISTEQ